MNLVFAQPVGRDVKGNRRRRGRFGPVASYALFAALGGAASGSAAGSVGVLLRSDVPYGGFIVWTFGGLLTAIALERELTGRVAPLPERRRQVPRHWLNWSDHRRTGAAFGFLIGSGVFTYLHHAIAYVLLALLLCVGTPRYGFLIGGIYGATRGAMLLASWVRYGASPFDLEKIHPARWTSRPLLAALAALTFTVLAAWTTST